jgi:hypothetical protein
MIADAAERGVKIARISFPFTVASPVLAPPGLNRTFLIRF